MKILLVDDNEEITQMLSKYLSLEKFDVTVANDGRNGLQLIKNQRFDFVLLDLAMPEFSGIDVLESLAKDGLINKQKIILFTASSITEQEEKRLMRLGIHSCIRKPIKMPSLLQILQSG